MPPFTANVAARARALGPLDPEAWLPPVAAPYPPPYRGVGRRPASGPVLADLRGRYRELVDSCGDVALVKVHKALARQIRDDFLAAWRVRLDLDPATPLHVVAPVGARRVGALVAEPLPEELITVLAQSLVAAPAQNPGTAPGIQAAPAFDYTETSAAVQRNRPEPLPPALLAVAPSDRRQPTMRDGVRSHVADAYLNGAAGLPAAFFAGRPGVRHRPAAAQDLLLRVDRGYASGAERAAIVAGHTTTVDELAAAVTAQFGADPAARVEWGMTDPHGEHAGLTSRHAQVPRCLLRLAVGAPAPAGADPRYGPLLAQTAPTPVCSVLGVGVAAWIRVVGADGVDEWFAVRALAGGPAGQCCPAGPTAVVSTLIAPEQAAA